MLPFLQPKKLSAVIMASHKPNGSVEPENEEGEHTPELMGASEDLISAIHSKDAKAVADAITACYACLGYSGEAAE